MYLLISTLPYVSCILLTLVVKLPVLFSYVGAHWHAPHSPARLLHILHLLEANHKQQTTDNTQIPSDNDS